jgi:hypothetical protein
MLKYDPHKPAARKAVSAIVGSMMRLGIRDFSRALQRRDVVVSGPQRELWALRATGRLSLKQMAAINRSIQGLKDSVSVPQQRGRLYAITVLLTPLDRRRSSDAGRPKSKGRKS